VDKTGRWGTYIAGYGSWDINRADFFDGLTIIYTACQIFWHRGEAGIRVLVCRNIVFGKRYSRS
jgi:hypothetical protein